MRSFFVGELLDAAVEPATLPEPVPVTTGSLVAFPELGRSERPVEPFETRGGDFNVAMPAAELPRVRRLAGL
jgi:hypothetical protein